MLMKYTKSWKIVPEHEKVHQKLRKSATRLGSAPRVKNNVLKHEKVHQKSIKFSKCLKSHTMLKHEKVH